MTSGPLKPAPHINMPETPVKTDPVVFIDAPPAAPQGRVFHADLGLRIDEDGLWHYHGSPIRRKELICLFATTLIRDADGGYWLVTPTEMGRIDVDDAPFVAVEVFAAGSGEHQIITLRTNIDELVTVDRRHSVYVVTDAATGEPRPYVRLSRAREARIVRSAFYDLVALGVERTLGGQREFGVWSQGDFYSLGDPGPAE